MADLHEQIADLEVEIEEMRAAADRCRKTIHLAQILAGAGILGFLLIVTGILRGSPESFVLAIAAALGGLALFGSSHGTLEGLTTGIRTLEARRAALIDGIGLHVIEGGRGARESGVR